jgi:hypothetical protein
MQTAQPSSSMMIVKQEPQISLSRIPPQNFPTPQQQQQQQQIKQELMAPTIQQQPGLPIQQMRSQQQQQPLSPPQYIQQQQQIPALPPQPTTAMPQQRTLVQVIWETFLKKIELNFFV